MKQLAIIFIASLLLTFNVLAQGGYREETAADAVPAKVTKAFDSQFDGALAATWYGTDIVYWYMDYGVGWYGMWYAPKSPEVYTYEKAPYYEVQFVKKTAESARAIYNQYGAWYETRTQIRELPEAITEALKESKYKDWKIGEHKEIIEQPGTDALTYRILAQKGGQSLILSLDAEGQVTNIKEKVKVPEAKEE